MADEKDQYTDENAKDDFNSGFLKPDATQPAVVKAEDDGKEEKVEGKTEGDDKTEGDAKTEGAENTEGGDKTEGDAKTEGADEVVTVTKAQLERLLASADKADSYEGQIRKLFGTTGDMQRLVKQIQDATPKGAKLEIPADAFKEMEEEYPEIAAHMRKSLEKALSGNKGTGDEKPAGSADDGKGGDGVKPEAVQALVENAVTRREMQTLEEEHPNWRGDVGAVSSDQKPDPKHPFRAWLSTQPAEYQKKVNETDSPLVLNRALDRFKAFKAAPKKTPPPKDDKKVAAKNSRIEDALTPKGDGNPPPKQKSAEDHFNDGFKSG